MDSLTNEIQISVPWWPVRSANLMNLSVLCIQEGTLLFKDAQRWAAVWAPACDNMLAYNKMHFKASTEGYEAAAAGCCKMAAEQHLQPAEERGRTLNEAASAAV